MRRIYTFLFYCALPFILIRLWWKGKKNPGYRLRWRERLGFISPPPIIGNVLWLHAVSLGEMITAKPLIQAIRAQYPDTILIITTTTVSGSSLAAQYVDDRTYHCYLPYDLPSAIERFLDHIHPQQVVIMETELWPNLLHCVAQRGIPILLANARLSQRSMQSYLRIKKFMQQVLPHITCIAAQTQADADRFAQLGAKPNQLHVIGNIKFDVPLPTHLIEQGRALRESWSATRPTLIAASTHTGEEEIILAAFQHFLNTHPDALLILVPRHPERFDVVATLCEQQHYNFIRRTQNLPCLPTTQIFLGDSLGELFLYYAMADIAFVGGSFAPIGGHNPLEPAALALPVITGPNISNFTQIFALLEEAGAAMIVTDAAALGDAWINLMRDSEQRAAMGKAGQQVRDQNKGAVERHLTLLAPLPSPYTTTHSR